MFCCQEADELYVTIYNGLGNGLRNIYVPTYKTVRRVILDLIGEGFIDFDTRSTTTALYNLGDGIRYDQNKTIKECGWKNGQIFIALSEYCD